MATRRLNLNQAARKLILWLVGADPANCPSISAEAGAPSAAEPNGSLYLRTDGGHGTTLYARAAGAWQALVGPLFASVAASTAITGATEAETNFDQTATIPANKLKAGSTIRIRGFGVHTATSGTETHTILLKLGSTTLCQKASVDPADNDLFYFDFLVTVRTAGASGTMVGSGQMAFGASGTAGDFSFALGSTAVDTTAAQVVAVAIDRQASATDSDSARLDQLVVNIT